MRWKGRRESDNIEDRRGMAPPGRGPGGFRIPVSLGGKKGGIGGIGLIVVVLVAVFLGVDPRTIFQGAPPGGQTGDPRASLPAPGAGRTGADRELRKFVAVVLADTEETWRVQFRGLGRTYQEPKLVLFSGAVRSACGYANAAVGPFYCPGDRKVYLDFSFFRQLKNRFRAPGDFAQAYVIAHEVGHHVQTLLGISEKVHGMRQRLDRVRANALSVRFELQADCLAGVWAHHAKRTRNILEPGDLEEALRAATAIGDDNIQRKTQGTVVPDSFTHGTSEQRVRWFKRGFETGRIKQCDTFNADRL